MYKSKNNILEKTTLLALIVAMLISVVAFPISVSAATKKTTIPRSFASKESCLAKLNTYKLASLKTYGDKRIDIRLNYINRQPAIIEQKYKKYEKAEPEAEKKVAAANYIRKAAVGEDSKSEISISSRKGSLLDEISATKKEITAKKTDLNQAKTSKAASEAICSLMFDLRVYSYLSKKINVQLRVDSVRLRIAQNNAEQEAIEGIIQKYKNDKDFAKKTKNIKSKIESLPNNQVSISKLNDSQDKLDKINVVLLNTENETTKAELATIDSETKASSKTAISEGKKIKSLYKTITKIFEKKQKKDNKKDNKKDKKDNKKDNKPLPCIGEAC